MNTSHEDDLNKAIKYMLVAGLLFAVTGAFAKVLGEFISSLEVAFFRNSVGLILILISVYKLPIKNIGGKPLLLFARGFIGFVALLAYFYNIVHIPLAEAQTFSKTSPIFTAIFSYLLLRESLSFKSWIGVMIGFIGILFITGFDVTNLSKTDWLGIFSGIGAALAYTSIRELKKYYETRMIVLSFMGVGTLGPIILMGIAEFYTHSELDFLLSPFIMPSGIMWVYILGLGITATFSQLFMTKAYSLAKGGIVGTIGYSNVIFSIFFGMMLGDAFPTLFVLVGIGLIIFSGYLVSKD